MALLVPITQGYNPEYLKPNPEAAVPEGGQINKKKLTKQNKRQGIGKLDIALDHFNILNILRISNTDQGYSGIPFFNVQVWLINIL